MLLNQTAFTPTMAFLTPTQSELMEKFNAAFYDAQIKPRTCIIDDELFETFDERYFANIEAYEDHADNQNIQENNADCTKDWLLPDVDPNDCQRNFGIRHDRANCVDSQPYEGKPNCQNKNLQENNGDYKTDWLYPCMDPVDCQRSFNTESNSDATANLCGSVSGYENLQYIIDCPRSNICTEKQGKDCLRRSEPIPNVLEGIIEYQEEFNCQNNDERLCFNKINLQNSKNSYKDLLKYQKNHDNDLVEDCLLENSLETYSKVDDNLVVSCLDGNSIETDSIDAFYNDAVSTFDYTELSRSFEESLESIAGNSNLEENGSMVKDEKSVDFPGFFVQPPFVLGKRDQEEVFQLEDDFEGDLESILSEDSEKLPPIQTIGVSRGNCSDLTNFLRSMPGDTLDIFAEVSKFVIFCAYTIW